MFKIAFTFSILLSTVLASECDVLKRVRQRLEVSTLNFANHKTSRTEKGGVFVRRILGNCQKSHCMVRLDNNFTGIRKYQPAHPDADSKGIVVYPNINRKHEYVTARNAALLMKLIAEKGNCGTELTSSGDLTLINYPYSFIRVHSDRFLFNGHQLVSWEVELKNGETSTFHF